MATAPLLPSSSLVSYAGLYPYVCLLHVMYSVAMRQHSSAATYERAFVQAYRQKRASAIGGRCSCVHPNCPTLLLLLIFELGLPTQTGGNLVGSHRLFYPQSWIQQLCYAMLSHDYDKIWYNKTCQAMPYNAMPSYACYAILWHGMLCSCNAKPCQAVQCYAML